MTGIQGRTKDGRPAWLLSLRRREWVVVQGDVHAQLVKERHRFWLKGLYLLIILLALNPLVDYLLDLHTSPWIGLLLAHLHLVQENFSWARKLHHKGDVQHGGVTPVDLPREWFWQALSFVPLLMALPVAFLGWHPGGMRPRSFILLMLLFWVLIALEIRHGRRLRVLHQESGGVDPSAP